MADKGGRQGWSSHTHLRAETDLPPPPGRGRALDKGQPGAQPPALAITSAQVASPLRSASFAPDYAGGVGKRRAAGGPRAARQMYADCVAAAGRAERAGQEGAGGQQRKERGGGGSAVRLGRRQVGAGPGEVGSGAGNRGLRLRGLRERVGPSARAVP